MLDVVFGSGSHGELAQCLRESIQDLDLNGTLYFSYPTFGSSNASKPAKADALLVSEKYGIIAFDLSMYCRNRKSIDKWTTEIKIRQNELCRNMDLLFYASMNQLYKQNITVNADVITIVNNLPKKKLNNNIKITDIKNLHSVIGSNRSPNSKHIVTLNSIIHGISKTTSNHERVPSQHRGFSASIFDNLGKTATCLDTNQVQAALSCPLGPQRIRGLAGSGKTTVLALKAAHLHIANPDWNIAVTYRNAALGPYFKSLIQRFMDNLNQGEPDWSKLHILESLGRDNSFYDNVARKHGFPREEMQSRDTQNSFDRTFEKGRRRLERSQYRKPLYDVIIIDDAQEFPSSFFKFAYAAVKFPKRIIWASDEFQSLMGYAPLTPEDLFGCDKNGRPKVVLKDKIDQPPQDIVLGNCYRSTSQALTVALGLACGIHRKSEVENENAIVQMYDEPEFWEDIGYKLVDGELKHGESVSLKRDSTRNIMRAVKPPRNRARPNNTFYLKRFDNPIAQWNWISKKIVDDIADKKLLAKDILIVFSDLRSAYEGNQYISTELEKKKISSNIIIPPTSREKIFAKNSVKISNVFGAKEVEFPMVYFANAQQCYGNLNPPRMRNRLYTGITRSSSWVRLCVVGRRGKMLEEEFQSLVRDRYHLNFNYPTNRQMQKTKEHFHKARPTSRDTRRTISEFSDIIDMIRDKKVSASVLPQSLRKKLLAYLQESQ